MAKLVVEIGVGLLVEVPRKVQPRAGLVHHDGKRCTNCGEQPM